MSHLPSVENPEERLLRQGLITPFGNMLPSTCLLVADG